MIERQFDPTLLYNRIVHFYVDRHGYTKEAANAIAQRVIRREAERRTCRNIRCRHSMDDHIRNAETCLILECECRRFERAGGGGKRAAAAA